MDSSKKQRVLPVQSNKHRNRNISTEHSLEVCTADAEVPFDPAEMMRRNQLMVDMDSSLLLSRSRGVADRAVGWANLADTGHRICLVVHNSSLACLDLSR